METESGRRSFGLTVPTGECRCGKGSCGSPGDGCSTMIRLVRLQEVAYAVVDAWDSHTREDLDDRMDQLWKELIRRD